MDKRYLFSIVAISFGIVCLIIYSMIGAYVATDKTLVEPFFLIPISWLFILMGIMISLFTYILKRFKK